MKLAIGDTVKLKPGRFEYWKISGMGRQGVKGGIGIILRFDKSWDMIWVKVRWQNGDINNYPLSDLIKIRR